MPHEQTPPSDSPRLTLPRLTTPTWEVEMLLSGAVVFGLFQVPEPITRWAELASARSGPAGDTLVAIGLTYGLMVNYALIAMFLVHLTARAYWVALVGVDSVFPGGVRWENHRQGPISRAEMQRVVSSMPVLVERADNFASLCFGFGFLVVMSAVLGAMFAIPATAIALVVSEHAFDGRHFDRLVMAVMAVIIGPIALASFVDRVAVRRGWIAVDGWISRIIAAVYRLPTNTLPAPLMLMLTTNLRGRRITLLMVLAMLLLSVAMGLHLATRSGKLSVDGYDYLPADEDGIGVDPRHYRDLRNDAQGADALLVPSIDSMTPDGRYLRLFVPYRPERHGPLIERRCMVGSGGAPVGADVLGGAASATRLVAERSLLTCLARELELQVVGAPMPVDWLAFSQDAETGVRGLQAMIPIANLAPGRHVITLLAAANPRTMDDSDAMGPPSPPPLTTIAFWR